jgi:PAS domain S-box-containing protein
MTRTRKGSAEAIAVNVDVRDTQPLLKTGALQDAIFNSPNFSSIATDADGVIQVFNVGAERMLGYTAADVMNEVPLTDIADTRDVMARAIALSVELATPIAPGFEALVYKASQSIEDNYELTFLCKDGSRLPALVSVTALRDAHDSIIGYLLIGTDNTASKRAEEAYARLSAIVASSEDAIISKSLTGIITSWNPGAEKIFGYSAEEAMGHPMLVLIPAGRISEEPEILARIARGECVEHFETVRVRKDGEQIPISVTISPVRDSTGRVIGASKIARDVTNRRRAEALLRENDALAHVAAGRLAQVVQGMNEACFVLDREWRFTFLNDRSLTLFCLPRELMLGKSLWELFPKIVGTPTEAQYRLAMEKRVPVSFEVLSSVVERWLDIRLFPSGDGLAAFILDIDQRKRTEFALRASEAGMAAAQASANIGSWEIDEATRAVKWSAEMYRIFGRDSALGSPQFADIVQMVHPDDREAFLRNAELSTHELEFRVVRPDGDMRWIDGRGTVVLDDGGRPLRLAGTAQDITERAKAQSELRVSEARYHSTLDSILEACQLIGFDWTYLYLNDAAAVQNRRPNSELLGRKMTEAWPGITETGLFAQLRRCMEERLAHHEEFEFVYPDGAKGWFDIRCQPVPEGLFVLSIDTTERKHAKEALATAGPLQRAIFDSATFSSIATDAKGVIQIFNVGAERMLGYTAAEVMNKITPADLHDRKELIARASSLSLEFGTPIAPGFEAMVFKAARGIEDIYELTKVRKDGSRFPAIVSVTALRDAQNTIIGYLLIGTDNTARKRAEEALLKADALQSAIFNSANFSSIATDADGVIQIFNVGAERMLGYTAAEVMNKITPADISDPQEVIARATALSVELETPITPGFEALVFKASRGIEDIYELTYIRKDGSRFPAVVSVTALRDAQDSIIGYLLIGTDNTARKQAEEALLKAGALQSAIFNSANFSSIATDAKGVIQIFNVGAERMLGYTALEVMNKITPADISDPQEVIARATALSVELETPITPGFEALVFKASRGIEDIYELTYIRKDGSRFPAVVSVTALRDAQDSIIGYLLIGTDNTARMQVEEERTKLDQRLRDQHFYTRSLIESNIDALMTTDPRGIITDVNKQTEALTGCTRDELIGAPFRNYFTDSGRAEAGINRVLSEGKVTNFELTARARDGQLTVVSYNATTFHDRNRRLQGVVAAARDVTELKRFEQTLQQKNVELEAANRMKSEFLANMSHELRTPLNSIIGFSDVLKDGLMGELTEQQRGCIGNIFGSGSHLLSLINDILDLSKIEAGKMTLDLEPVHWPSLFANSLSVIKEMAATQRIRCTLEAANELGSTQADTRKVKQILYNLLSNAVKFTEEGGQVLLRASVVPRAKVGQLTGSRPGRAFPLSNQEFTDYLEISVTDSGIGISPEGLERLFKPFSQIDSGLARKYEGTGLGLAMVKLLVELHGGAVAVDSAVGGGSCFTAWLPLRAPEQAMPANALLAPRIDFDARERTALVVEDDFKAADLIRMQLEAEGFKVLHAASAEEALILAMRQPLSLITLDIMMMPDMDGWELLTRLKQTPELQRIPVVIISIAADRDKGFSLGAAAVMQKPVSRRELYRSLVDLNLLPYSQGQTLKVLVVDDDPKAVELIAVQIAGLASTVLRAHGGRDAIEIARRQLPQVIILDLMMPDVNGFDVVAALHENPDTARIPILVVTAKQITAEDRAKLSQYVITIMEKTEFDPERFTAEVRRAMSGRGRGV